MLENCFSAPKTLRRLRTGPSAPYIDGFASTLQESDYSTASAVRYLRAAVHLGHFLGSTGVSFADIDAEISETFRRHLPSCHCPLSNGGSISHHIVFGVKRFHRYLVQLGVSPSEAAPIVEPSEPPLIAGFRHWLEVHRGATPPTRRQYCRGASELLDALGADPGRWDAHRVRAFFLGRVDPDHAVTAEKRVTAVRAFLRYLTTQGQCPADLDRAVPAQAHWRLASLPQYLTSEQLEGLIAACEGDSCNRRRDRAMLHVTVCAGLRVSELIGLQLDDLALSSMSIRIHGKGRRERAIPLWKVTATALRAWLAIRGTTPVSEVFVNARGEPMTRWGFAYVLKRHVEKAARACPSLAEKQVSPHVLRHTCAMIVLQATQAIRKVSLWLGHANLATTEIYTRADPSEKLEAINAIVPPHLRKGKFRPPDKLIALLKDKSNGEQNQPRAH